MTTTPAISFADPDVRRCPHAAYAQLQAESPVYFDAGTGFHVVTRYADIAYVNARPEIFSNMTSQVFDRSHSPVAAEVARRYTEHGFLPVHTLVSNDPPSHGQYRALVDLAFARKNVIPLEPGIRDIVDGLIDGFIGAGRIAFFDDFAIKLPMFVIARELGLPREDWRQMKAWSDAAIEQINPNLAPERELELTDLLIGMQQYLHRHAMAYRANPAPCLLSAVANAQIDGRLLTDSELINIATQLLVAGNETTTNTLGSAVWALLETPDLRQRLSADPALIPGFVEEVLRLHSPVPNIYRVVREDTELAGVALAKGAVLMLSYGAGNRDENKFACPERIDPERRNAREHMSFGKGIHFCIGNMLARTELRIALERLLVRLPDFALDPDAPPLRWSESFQAHTLERLDLVFTPGGKS